MIVFWIVQRHTQASSLCVSQLKLIVHRVDVFLINSNLLTSFSSSLSFSPLSTSLLSPNTITTTHHHTHQEPANKMNAHKLKLRISIVDSNVIKAMHFNPSMTVHDACNLIKDKLQDTTNRDFKREFSFYFRSLHFLFLNSSVTFLAFSCLHAQSLVYYRKLYVSSFFPSSLSPCVSLLVLCACLSIKRFLCAPVRRPWQCARVHLFPSQPDLCCLVETHAHCFFDSTLAMFQVCALLIGLVLVFWSFSIDWLIDWFIHLLHFNRHKRRNRGEKILIINQSKQEKFIQFDYLDYFLFGFSSDDRNGNLIGMFVTNQFLISPVYSITFWNRPDSVSLCDAGFEQFFVSKDTRISSDFEFGCTRRLFSGRKSIHEEIIISLLLRTHTQDNSGHLSPVSRCLQAHFGWEALVANCGSGSFHRPPSLSSISSWLFGKHHTHAAACPLPEHTLIIFGVACNDRLLQFWRQL